MDIAELEKKFRDALSAVYIETPVHNGPYPNIVTRLALPPATRRQIWDVVLAIKVEEDGECSCNLQTIEHEIGCVFDPFIESFRQCSLCNGTGTLPGKTLKDLLEEV